MPTNNLPSHGEQNTDKVRYVYPDKICTFAVCPKHIQGVLILQSFDWLPSFHLQLLQAIPFIAVKLSGLVFLAACSKYCSPGLPTAFFFRILLLQECLIQTRYA
jgi:hypothetical protein